MQARVFCLVDHTHAAATQLLEDAVMRNGSACHYFEARNWNLMAVSPQGRGCHNGLGTTDNGRMTNPRSQIQNQTRRLSYKNYNEVDSGVSKAGMRHRSSI